MRWGAARLKRGTTANSVKVLKTSPPFEPVDAEPSNSDNSKNANGPGHMNEAKSALSPHDARRSRMRRLKLAVGSAIVSKFPGMILQVVCFPILLHAVGTARYALFFGLTSLLASASLLGSGLFPALSSALAAVVAREEIDLERRIVVDSTALFGGIALLFFMVGALIPISDVRWVVNASPNVSDRELWLAYLAVLLTTAANMFGAALASFRIGYQETHLLNILTALSNVFALGSILFVAKYVPTLSAFILVIYAPLNIVYIVDFVYLIQKRNLFGPSRLKFGHAVKRIFHASWPTLIVQWVWYFNTSGTIVLVSHLSGVHGTNAYSSVLRPLLIAVGIFSMFFQPMIPSVSSAWASRDVSWVRSMYRRLLLATLAMAGSLSLIFLIAGPWLFRLWLQRDLGISRGLCGVGGAYFLVWMLQFMNYSVLLALNGTRGIAPLYLAENALLFVLGVTLTKNFGAAGMMSALLISNLCVTGWALPIRVMRLLREAPA